MHCQVVPEGTFPLMVALLDRVGNKLGVASIRIRTRFAWASQPPTPHTRGLVTCHRWPDDFEISARNVDVFQGEYSEFTPYLGNNPSLDTKGVDAQGNIVQTNA